MRALAALLLLLLPSAASTQQGFEPPPRPTSFRYWRALDLPARAQDRVQESVQERFSPSACAVLDAEVFAHTGPTLSDIRLFTSLTQQETPFAITLSRTSPTGDPASILNLGLKSPRNLSFDLQMPPRPYSAVDLNLNAHDFLASAKVTGLTSPTDPHPTYLGVFTLFDLFAQHLGRSSTLPLAESTFPLLHIDLELTPAAGNTSFEVTPTLVAGAEVPPSRLAQVLYTPIAQTSTLTQRPRQTVATFNIPAHVPVERVTFAIDPGDHSNFSRPVTISARSAPNAQPEQLSGNISRVHLTESGQQVQEQSLSVPAILGANAQSPATIEVAIEDGDDRPLKISSVLLEMRQRKICFASPTPARPESIQVFYGGTDISAPVYDFGRIFNPGIATRTAILGPEHLNRSFHPVVRARTITERFPQLLWLTLIASISTLGLVAFRSARRI